MFPRRLNLGTVSAEHRCTQASQGPSGKMVKRLSHPHGDGAACHLSLVFRHASLALASRTESLWCRGFIASQVDPKWPSIVKSAKRVGKGLGPSASLSSTKRPHVHSDKGIKICSHKKRAQVIHSGCSLAYPPTQASLYSVISSFKNTQCGLCWVPGCRQKGGCRPCP